MDNTAQNIDLDTTDGMSAIDAAIAKAKARAAARSSGEAKEGKLKVSPEEREASRAAAKAERERLKAEKAAKKTGAPVHMSKVEKAASRLPSLGEVAKGLFEEATRTLNSEQLTAISLHFQHFNRVNATVAAVSAAPLKVGQVVRIAGGDPKFIGMTGHLEKVQRIRCYVRVPGVNRSVYCFTSDVSPIAEEGVAVSTDEGVEEASVAEAV